jgi:rhodanese-related sulfurtransferase/DNA-binding transcriptional ArsR family regulator
MSGRKYKDSIYKEFSRVGRAVASPRRLELLEVLAQGERSVEILAREIAQPLANTSHHLQVLREAQLVEARKEGLHVYYELAGPEVFELIRIVRLVAAKRLAEVERIVRKYLSARDELETVSRQELLDRVRAGTVIVLDVRPAEEYRAGHIPGAKSIPVDDLERRLGELGAGQEIVAYCRGPYCVMAYKAVEILRASGHQARRLADGLPEWRAEGLSVETSTPEVRK